jgi:pimeloyl-ACP methyl ester carboxylesterase
MRRTAFLASSAAATVLAGVPGLVRASADMTLVTPTGKLFGTLELPAAAGTVPVVLLISGSGPTDRDGNSPMLPGKNNSLKYLAGELLKLGVASLRYDKRAIGASAGAAVSEADLRFDNYVDDAVAWIAELRAQKRFSRIVVAGHSEGSLIGMIAAKRANADGFVSLDGAGRPAATVMREQIAKMAPAMPEKAAQANHALDELAAGRTIPDASPTDALFRPSVQPYIISWLKYDPAREIAALKIPVAIVQGTADIQVTQVDSDALHYALPSSRYVLVEGMNHVLKHAPDHSTDAALIAGYSDPSLPIEPAVVNVVAAIALGR